MSTNAINQRRARKSSHILPFLTNVAIEKMRCESFGFESDEYWRVLVNDSPQSLDGCADGPGESRAYANITSWLAGRAEVACDYGSLCQVDYSNGTNILSMYNF
jgi:acid phosphatase